MMNCLLLVLQLVVFLDFGLSSPPAPLNVHVRSLNFHHVLHWDPGPGTPPGTQYQIIRKVNQKQRKPLPYTKMTSSKLKLRKPYVTYVLSVRAFYNRTLSQESDSISFSPYTQTTIGPPKVLLAGCGNCIQINMSLPEADRRSGTTDMKTFYSGAQFRVFWRKHEEPVDSAITENGSYTVNNLQIGTEYCVQVHTKINVNRNTLPSAWNCTFTSIVEPSRDPVVLGGAVAASLIFVIGVLTSSMFFFYYTGFLCKLKATLPRVLMETLSRGYTLTPERTIPDQISVGAETEKQRKRNNPTTPQPASGGTISDKEEEEEDEGENVYIDRDAELSSGETSCQDSVDVLGNGKVAVVAGDSESLTGQEVEDMEAKAEGAELPFVPEGPVTGEEEEVVVVCESSGNINLFSITLAALTVCEEEEQNSRDSLTDSLGHCNVDPLLPTDSLRRSSVDPLLPTDSLRGSSEDPLVPTDSQTESELDNCDINDPYTRRLYCERV